MRASTVCLEPECPHPATRRGRCDAHAPRPWAGSPERRRRLGLPGRSVLGRLRLAVRRRARGRCEKCGAPVRAGAGAVDHRLPLAEGGETTVENLWLLCDECDAAKTRADIARMRAAAR